MLTLHEFEPNESSVITEGPSDQSVIRWFLDESDLHNVAVYEVSSLEVPTEHVHQYGQENSHRGRVITVAQLGETAGLATWQLVGVIDSDLDRLLLRAALPHKLLLTTDYACMEMYAWNAKTLNKFIRINRGRGRVETVIRLLAPLLHRLFLARAANATLGWSLQPVDWTPSAEIQGLRIPRIVITPSTPS